MEFDLHIHSKYSYDSLLKPERIIQIAKREGLSGIAITDHDTIKGGLKTAYLADSDIHVIIGSEIKTNEGEIIGLFLNEEIRAHRFTEVAEEIHDQGGITVLPHPFRKKKIIPKEVLKKIDLIEGLNARTEKELNHKACELGKKIGLPLIGGSDAHIGMEIGKARTIFINHLDNLEEVRKALLDGRIKISGKESPYWVHGYSITVEKVRSREFASLFKAVGRGVVSYIQKQW